MSHSPRVIAVTPPWLPIAIERAAIPCSASRDSTTVERDAMASHDHQIGQALLRADQRDVGGGTRHRARSPSASIARNPSACENAVTAPEPLPVGNAVRPSVALGQSDEHEFLASELGRDPHRNARAHVCAVSFGSPARARINGATKAWKVKIADVGKPGSTTIGFAECSLLRRRRDTAAFPA